MVISGLQVETSPETINNVTKYLTAISEVSFQERFSTDKIMVVVEADSYEKNDAAIKKILSIPPVLSVGLNYQLEEDSFTST